MRANLVGLAFGLCALGCGGVATLEDLGPVADLSQPGPDHGNQYPSMPYGHLVGDTFPLLQWEGYVNDAADSVATTKPFVSYSSDDARRSGRAFMIVHVAEYI